MENDLIRRSDAVDMFQRLSYDDWNQGAGTTWANAFSECEELIDMLPAVDAVEVVRCRKCKNWEIDWEPSHFNPEEERRFCALIDGFPIGYWFCADGQCREDGEG